MGKRFWFFDIHSGFNKEFSEPEQFTGLLDCNGKDIFEGDVLSYQSLKKPYNLIEFHLGAFGYFCFKGEDFEYFVSIAETYKSADCWEILGNIHENKNLLEQDK